MKTPPAFPYSWLLLILPFLIAVNGQATQPATPVYVRTIAELRSAVNGGQGNIYIMAPLEFAYEEPPIVFSNAVSSYNLFSPYRALVDFCDDTCNHGSQPLKSFFVVNGTQLFLGRMFFRNFLPHTAPSEALEEMGPTPFIQVVNGGSVVYNLVIWHFLPEMFYAFQRPSYWSSAASNGQILPVGTESPTLQFDTPQLHSLPFVNLNRHVINTCFSPFDVHSCYTSKLASTTLIYCPYTLADSLGNPYVSDVRMFHSAALDRSTYDYRTPIYVNRTVSYVSCPGTRQIIDLDDVVDGVVLKTGAQVTFRNFTFRQSAANNFTDWPQNNPLLLSTFYASGESAITISDCDILVADPNSLYDQLLALPGPSTAGDIPVLQPNMSRLVDDAFIINNWRLNKNQWLWYGQKGGSLQPSSGATWFFENVNVSYYVRTGTGCFHAWANFDPTKVNPPTGVVVTDAAGLTAALVNNNIRYIQVAADIALDRTNWPSTVTVNRLVEVRGCHPVPGQRYSLDMGGLASAIRSSAPGRVLFEGDLRFVDLGWSQAALGVPLQVMACFDTVGTATVEFQNVEFSDKIPASLSPNGNSILAASLGLPADTSGLPPINVTMDLTDQGGIVHFGICSIVRNGTQAISYINTKFCWTFSTPVSSSSTPVAAIVVPLVVGPLVLVAVITGFVLLYRRYKRPRSLEVDTAMDKLRSMLDVEGASTPASTMTGHASSCCKESSEQPLTVLTMGTDTSKKDSTRKSAEARRSLPSEGIQAARHELMGAKTSAVANSDSIVLVAVLGEGSYGKVYKAFWKDTLVAVKVMTLPSSMSGSEKREHMAVMETAISSSLSHPNIVQTFTYSVDEVIMNNRKHVAGGTLDLTQDASAITPDAGSTVSMQRSRPSSAGTGWEVRLVQELCDKGSLRDALDAHIFKTEDGMGSVDLAAVIETAIDVARAMAHLHVENIIHSDLKPRNVLLKTSNLDTRGFTAKVADFGLSLRIEPYDTHISNAHQGTATHMAPEVLLVGRISKAADVYSFGILLWELYTGEQPFRNIPNALMGYKITKENLRPVFPSDCPFDLQLLACRCWESDPDIRPTFDMILDELKRIKCRAALAAAAAAGQAVARGAALPGLRDAMPAAAAQVSVGNWGLPVQYLPGYGQVTRESPETPEAGNADGASAFTSSTNSPRVYKFAGTIDTMDQVPQDNH